MFAWGCNITSILVATIAHALYNNYHQLERQNQRYNQSFSTAIFTSALNSATLCVKTCQAV